jgi:hypothetical protein
MALGMRREQALAPRSPRLVQFYIVMEYRATTTLVDLQIGGLTNLVETLELEAMEGHRLCGCEIFVFTDNLMAEAAFFLKERRRVSCYLIWF